MAGLYWIHNCSLVTIQDRSPFFMIWNMYHHYHTIGCTVYMYHITLPSVTCHYKYITTHSIVSLQNWIPFLWSPFKLLLYKTILLLKLLQVWKYRQNFHVLKISFYFSQNNYFLLHFFQKCLFKNKTSFFL